jgi:hypothetical protein
MTEIAIPKAWQVNAEKTADHKATAAMIGVADAYDLIAEETESKTAPRKESR